MIKYVIANIALIIFIAGLFELLQIASRRYWKTRDDSIEEALWNALRVILFFLLIIFVAAFTLTTTQLGYFVCFRSFYA